MHADNEQIKSTDAEGATGQALIRSQDTQNTSQRKWCATCVETVDILQRLSKEILEEVCETQAQGKTCLCGGSIALIFRDWS